MNIGYAVTGSMLPYEDFRGRPFGKFRLSALLGYFRVIQVIRTIREVECLGVCAKELRNVLHFKPNNEHHILKSINVAIFRSIILITLIIPKSPVFWSTSFSFFLLIFFLSVVGKFAQGRKASLHKGRNFEKNQN